MNIFKTLGIVLLLVVQISCHEKEVVTLKDGQVQFIVGLDESGLKSSDIENAKSVIVSITDAENCIYYDTELVKLGNFNGYFLSTTLSLKPGNYRLAQFLVLDATGNVICASPKEGSDLASLVEDPLPIDFQVTEDDVTKLAPELIDVSDYTPSEFGYATFILNITETFSFKVSVFEFNTETYEFELTNASIKIKGESDSITKLLGPGTNSVRVWDNDEDYSVEISKDQYEPYMKTFTLEELKAFTGTPLIVYFGDEIKPFNLQVSVFEFNQEIYEYELSDAYIEISGEGGSITKDLEASINEIRIWDEEESYLVKISKDQYEPYIKTFTLEELKAFIETPLVVKFGDEIKAFSFQISVYEFNQETYKDELTGANIEISGVGGFMTRILEPVTNEIRIWDEDESYLVKISKEPYESYEKVFTLDELKAYAETPLIVKFGKPSGLVAYYPFNGDANDYSGFDNHGVVHGAVLSADKDGNENSAYYFNGNNSYIDIGNSPLIKRYQSDFSVTGWINLYEYGSTYQSIILSDRNPSSGGSIVSIGGLLSSEAKKVLLQQNTYVTNDIYTWDYLGSSTSVSLNSWCFFGITYEYSGGSSNVIKVYFNGVMESMKSVGEILDPGNANTYIGYEPYSAPAEYYFNGCMDEIRIYNKVLDELEIKYLYENSK